MANRRNIFFILGIALFMWATVAMFEMAGSQTISAHSGSVYQKLQEAAARGDKWARRYLVQVDTWLIRQGRSVPPQEREVGAVDTVNGIPIWVRGIEPFFLKIYNNQDLDTLNELQMYIKTRQFALSQLVNRNPNRQIEISISLNEYTSVPQVWRLIDTYGVDVDQMTVHCFLRGKWHSVMFVGDPRDPGEQPIIDFDGPAEAVERQLRQLIPSEAFVSNFDNPHDLEFKISWMRGKMRAANAIRLNSEPLVMLVDPISDLLDAYSGYAIDIEVVDVPHLSTIKRRIEMINNRTTK